MLYTRLKYCPTLPLKAFRREPAITQLDKSFAPILFGENQLLPSLISLSLLSSAHRRPFQRSLVRTSTPCYGSFTLSKDSSHGLRVQRNELGSPCSDSLSLRLPFRLGLLATLTRGLIMQKANGRVTNDASIACGRTISGLFHSASSGSFRLSLAVLVHYRSSVSI